MIELIFRFIVGGLACFAIALWRLQPGWTAILALLAALAIWLALAAGLWLERRIHYGK